VGVCIEKLGKARAGARSTHHHPLSSTPATGELRGHGLPLLFIDKPVVVCVHPVEGLRRKLAGELVFADLLIFVLIQLRKGWHLKLHHPLAASAESTGRRRRLILSQDAPCRHRDENQQSKKSIHCTYSLHLNRSPGQERSLG